MDGVCTYPNVAYRSIAEEPEDNGVPIPSPADHCIITHQGIQGIRKARKKPSLL